MPIPDLTIPAGFTLLAQGTGAPVNGANAFGLPFVDADVVQLDQIDPNTLEVDVVQLGPSVSAVTEGAPLLNAAKTQMTLDFVQTGSDQVEITVRIPHSIVR